MDGARFERCSLFVCVCVCVCLRTCSPNLSRSQRKVLESLEIIPQHGEPVTTANYDNVRRYLIKVRRVIARLTGFKWLVTPNLSVAPNGQYRRQRPPCTQWAGWWRPW